MRVIVKKPAAAAQAALMRPTALGSYATVFEEMNALQHFEAFTSLNGRVSMACR